VTSASDSIPALQRHAVPVWAVNVGLLTIIACLWPVNGLLESHTDGYTRQILIAIGINVILAVSLNLINGITGQFSLGHAGFMAVGAYATGAILKYYQTFFAANEWALALVLIFAGLLAAVAGLLVGIPALRLRGDYLAIATLGFGEIINVLINNTEKIGPIFDQGPFEIGGAAGLHGIPPSGNLAWIYAGALICIVVVWRLANSTKGKAFEAVREDEIAAAAMGVDTTYYKVSAFVIGAFFAGVAGGLFATSYFGDLAPESFGFMRSIDIIVMVVLGGSGSITGSILAAALLTYLPEQLRFLKDFRLVIYSLILIGMMLTRPEGLLGNRELWWTRRGLLRWPRQDLGEAQEPPPIARD
jgi:branched-chain amino acid transport system permease protein